MSYHLIVIFFKAIWEYFMKHPTMYNQAHAYLHVWMSNITKLFKSVIPAFVLYYWPTILEASMIIPPPNHSWLCLYTWDSKLCNFIPCLPFSFSHTQTPFWHGILVKLPNVSNLCAKHICSIHSNIFLNQNGNYSYNNNHINKIIGEQIIPLTEYFQNI